MIDYYNFCCPLHLPTPRVSFNIPAFFTKHTRKEVKHMKKLLMIAAFFAATSPAMATFWQMPSISSADIIGNDLVVVAKSGDNSITGATNTFTTVTPFFSKPMTMITGGGMVQGITTGATMAIGTQTIQANSGPCTMCTMMGPKISDVKFNDVKVIAVSGDNSLSGVVNTNTFVTGGFTKITGGGLVQGVTTGGSSASGDQWIIANVSSAPVSD